ncbi:MAG: hypothetical protein LBP23_04370 [Treponema sp.]|nr:hypothetical protein [Treponema sp.]
MLAALPAAAAPGDRGEFFAGVLAESALYSVDGAAFGGGLAAGYGFDIGAVGLRADYLVDLKGLTTFAPGLFVRFCLPLPPVNTAPPFRRGPFLQLDLGPSFHARDPRVPPAALAGAVSAGLSAGWRFLLGDHWYTEPALRAGYPFLAGAAVTAGYRF